MSLDRRLEKLEENLTPTEAVIRWTREVREFGSFPAYFTWLSHQPAELWPFEQLPTQAARGARVRAKGAPAEQVAASVRQAERDVVLLLVMHQIANLEVARELTIQMVRTEHIFDLLRELIQLDCACGGLRRDRLTLQLPQLLVLETETLERRLGLARRCRREIAQALFRVQALPLAAERLSSAYMRRHSFLVPDLRQGLTIIRQTLTAQLKVFEELDLGREPQSEADAIRSLVREAVGHTGASLPPVEEEPEAGEVDSVLIQVAGTLAQRWVLQARAETHHLVGDASASQSLLEQCLETVPPDRAAQAARAAKARVNPRASGRR
jgi:hypothetical protein